jgi:hypothetical protein
MKMPGDTTTHTRDITLDTYRYLRGGMAVMIVMLGAAVIGELWFPRNRGGFPMPLPAWSWIP